MERAWPAVAASLTIVPVDVAPVGAGIAGLGAAAGLPAGPGAEAGLEARLEADPGALIRTCANCGAAMDERKCKLICSCGYFLSCSDYY